jgi:dihydrofolate synthase/folylpolyglutamate synthase
MVLEQIKKLPHHALHIITGFVKDKDVQQVLSLFPTQAIYYFTQAPIPRALPCAELKSLAESKGLRGQAFPSVLSAFEQAQKNANKEDIILITGSFFILEEIYNLLEPENED